MSEWLDPKLYQHRYSGPVWNWFGLTYSSYLIIPRSLMCGMPVEWQRRQVALLEEMREVYDTERINDKYVVHLGGDHGRWEKDPLADYRHATDLPYRRIPTAPPRSFNRWLFSIADFAHWHDWYGRRFWGWLIARLERRRSRELTALFNTIEEGM